MVQCTKGYKNVGNKCVQVVRRVVDGITRNNKIARYVLIGMTVILLFILVINSQDWSLVRSVIISLALIGVSLAVYSIREYQDDLIGVNPKKFPSSLLMGILFAGGYILITRLVPYFSLAYPSFPASIGTGLIAFMIIGVSPVTETFFFQSVVYAFFINFMQKRKWLGIVIASVIFSSFHLASYILGFYAMDVGQGITAFTSNISAFISAGIFSFAVMVFALKDGIENADAQFIIFSHVLINLASYSFSIIAFV